MEDNTFIVFLILLLAGFVLLTQGPTGRAVYTDDNFYSAPEQDESYVPDNQVYRSPDIYDPMAQVIQEKRGLIQQMGSEDLNELFESAVNTYSSQPPSPEAATFVNILLKSYQSPQSTYMDAGDIS